MFLFSDIENFSQELVTSLPPDPPNNAIYIGIIDDHVVVPSITSTLKTDTSAAIKRATASYQVTASNQATASNQDTASNQATTSNQATASNQDTTTYQDEADEDEDQIGKSLRFDWKMSATRKLLSILIDKR